MPNRKTLPAIVVGSVVLVGLPMPTLADTYKMTTEIAPGVITPDKMESSLGTLTLNEGFPTEETTARIWDNLDRSRALQAYLLAIPIVNQAGMRDSILKFGPVNQTNVIWEDLVDPRTVELTAKTTRSAASSGSTRRKAPSWWRFRPRCWGRSTISGTSGWWTWA